MSVSGVSSKVAETSFLLRLICILVFVFGLLREIHVSQKNANAGPHMYPSSDPK